MPSSVTNRSTIPIMLQERAELHPTKPFVRCGDEARSYGEMVVIAEEMAGNLMSAGVNPGDRVALLLPNRIETLESFFGLARLGAVQIPMNVFLKGEFLRYQLSDSRAATLVTDEAGLDTVQPILRDLPSLERVVVVDEGMPDRPGGLLGVPYRVLLHGGRTGAPPAPSSADGLMMILYTSGTTGLPKGCMISHGYCIQVGVAFTDWLDAGCDDVLFTALPLYHVGGLINCTMVTLVNGMSAVFEPQFSASNFMASAGQAGATLLMGVGAMGAAILATAPADTDRAHRVRRALFLPLSPAAQTEFERRFGVELTAEGYGQTECSPISYSPPGAPRKRQSAGRPLPWIEVRILDAHDQMVQPGEVGEIAIRPSIPDAMFQGYWGKPDVTAEAFRNLWYHMGDLGRMDEDGFLYFVDRKKDALRRRGENVSSMELEVAIRRFPKVADVAVHAVPAALGEDDIKACLVLKPGQATTPEELFDFFQKELPYFAVPRYVDVVGALPKNELGRVLKHRLRDLGVTATTWDLQQLGLVVERADRRGRNDGVRASARQSP